MKKFLLLSLLSTALCAVILGTPVSSLATDYGDTTKNTNQTADSYVNGGSSSGPTFEEVKASLKELDDELQSDSRTTAGNTLNGNGSFSSHRSSSRYRHSSSSRVVQSTH